MEQCAIGVDLGATKIATALVTRSGQVLGARQTLTLVDEGAPAVIRRIAGEVRALMSQAPGAIVGVGIGSPGLVDSRNGIVQKAVNMRWDEVHLADDLSRQLDGIPVRVENDANAAAVGEGVFGSAKGCSDYIVLTVGSGLGAGAVAAGRLITGAHWMATDLGHYVVDPDHGRPCVCGLRGCVETVVSGPGLLAEMRSILSRGSHRSRLRDDETLTTGLILDAARQGDEAALAAVEKVGQWLGHIAAIAAAVIDPQVVVIGGGLGVAGSDLLLPAAQKEMFRRLPGYHSPRTIALRASTLISSAVGAASLVWSPGV